MAQTANKTAIGAFVAGSITLLIAAVIFFGSNRLFASNLQVVFLFDSSIAGLSVGSQVVLKGVPIGRVKKILVKPDFNNLEYTMPVIAEIDLDNSDQSMMDDPERELNILERLIAKGLYGKLGVQSILTGQLLIELQLAETPPEVPLKMRLYEKYPVIPTKASILDEAITKLSSIPVTSIAKNMLEISEKLNAVLDSINQSEMVPHLTSIIQCLDHIAQESQKLPSEVQKTLASVRYLSTSTGQFFKNTEQNFGDTSRYLQNSLKTAYDAIQHIEKILVSVSSSMNPNSPMMYSLNTSLQEITATAEAIRELTQLLTSRPEVLIRGK